jgi:hypothetical protein
VDFLGRFAIRSWHTDPINQRRGYRPFMFNNTERQGSMSLGIHPEERLP